MLGTLCLHCFLCDSAFAQRSIPWIHSRTGLAFNTAVGLTLSGAHARSLPRHVGRNVPPSCPLNSVFTQIFAPWIHSRTRFAFMQSLLLGSHSPTLMPRFIRPCWAHCASAMPFRTLCSHRCLSHGCTLGLDLRLYKSYYWAHTSSPDGFIPGLDLHSRKSY